MHQKQNLIRYFSPAPEESDLPVEFPNPFENQVHPIAVAASELLQERLKLDPDLSELFVNNNYGAMFGVLVVQDNSGLVGFLSAFSGILFKRKDIPDFIPDSIPGFVPSIGSREGTIKFLLLNQLGEKKSVSDFFQSDVAFDDIDECVAPKLLQYAINQSLKPLALAEFWWGASPIDRVRHPGYFYPACRGKCEPLLPFLLKGINVKPFSALVADFENENEPEVIYEDNDLIIVVKPAGMLSVPGKDINDSVLTRLRKRYPQATGALLLHRLDLMTSGLMLAAKNADAHKKLQKQFIDRTIRKRYVAVLSRRLNLANGEVSGTIDLPLRLDIEDRPRQLVCYNHGKSAVTHWEIIEDKADTTRIYFFPETGRTHQLRVHAAHISGLNAPIVGDSLYGHGSSRLLLHAEYLCFVHPVTGEQTEFFSTPPF